jgi:hypothetical protein
MWWGGNGEVYFEENTKRVHKLVSWKSYGGIMIFAYCRGVTWFTRTRSMCDGISTLDIWGLLPRGHNAQNEHKVRQFLSHPWPCLCTWLYLTTGEDFYFKVSRVNDYKRVKKGYIYMHNYYYPALLKTAATVARFWWCFPLIMELLNHYIIFESMKFTG